MEEYTCDWRRINDDNKVIIASLGGVEVILTAMRKHKEHADLQEYASGALFNLAINDD